MFITKEKFEYFFKLQDNDIQRLNSKIYEIQGQHYRLLKHLGLEESTTPQITELRKKGGPERGE